ncbi:hypothetical protein [Rhodococcus opacus]|nr:hypothetical protein [Rhodococcus opacus]MDJ0413816.1 hypothetical protein [Rhodococcus opacus]
MAQYNIPGTPAFVRVNYGSGKPSNLHVQGGVGGVVVTNIHRKLA